MNNFYKTSTAYKVLDLINTERESLKSDLVAYSNDLVRYSRRFRMLINLAQYEVNILTKLQNFCTDDANDLKNTVIDIIRAEIKSIVDRDA